MTESNAPRAAQPSQHGIRFPTSAIVIFERIAVALERQNDQRERELETRESLLELGKMCLAEWRQARDDERLAQTRREEQRREDEERRRNDSMYEAFKRAKFIWKVLALCAVIIIGGLGIATQIQKLLGK